MGQLGNIHHIVVLMLENRSFDCLLGTLYKPPNAFEGLSGAEQNLDPNGTAVPVWNSPGTAETTMRIPDPDPGELWTDINTQLFGAPDAPKPGQAPTMMGFVKNYLAQKAQNPNGNYDPKSVIHYFTPDQVPVLSKLAQQFAVCDHWFASAPCQTWPNRWFAHAATADGHENNDPPRALDAMTIYNTLEEKGIAWKIYFHDFAQAHTLLQIFLLGGHFQSCRQFQADCQSGQLPSYSFIEPQYYADLVHPENDQHPPSVVTLGEQLIADVYDCLRYSKLWPKTLLIITYDEHGGCYDHVAPPAAVPPAPPVARQTFAFDRYGVRVPAVIVSPYVEPGTVFGKASTVPFDHTSIIATVRKRFGISQALTARDAKAPDLDSILTLPKPTNGGPRRRLKALPYAPSPKAAAVAQAQPLNNMQKALVGAAANLPTAPGTNLQARLNNLRATGPQQPPAAATATVHDARNYVKKQAGNYFQSQ